MESRPALMLSCGLTLTNAGASTACMLCSTLSLQAVADSDRVAKTARYILFRFIVIDFNYLAGTSLTLSICSSGSQSVPSTPPLQRKKVKPVSRLW